MVPLLLLSFISLLVTLGKTQRSIVLTQWFGTGIRNAKYETIGNNILDSHGNIVPQTSNGRKDVNGRMIYDCTDIMGKVRQNGEEYERPNHRFKYKCNNGTEIITACIGSERIAKAIIKVDQTFTKDGFWHKCIHHVNNETAIYMEERGCNSNNKLYHVGDEIRSEFLLMKCSENGYKIIGCYYVDNKKVIDMKPGTIAEVNGTMHHCDDNNNNIQYYTTKMGCMKYDNKYAEGEQFAKNHLRYECKNGMVVIVGCYMDEIGRNIEIGDIVVNNHMLYKCYIENGEVRYEQYPCGLRGTPSCEASQRQQMSLKMPTAPKPRPGFGAFSIAQNINQGNDKVVSIGIK
ncbi:hypothetical protein ACH3XW_34130 [Acanthocheilonema viteae]